MRHDVDRTCSARGSNPKSARRSKPLRRAQRLLPLSYFSTWHCPSPAVSCGLTTIWSALGDLDQLGFHLRNPPKVIIRRARRKQHYVLFTTIPPAASRHRDGLDTPRSRRGLT